MDTLCTSNFHISVGTNRNLSSNEEDSLSRSCRFKQQRKWSFTFRTILYEEDSYINQDSLYNSTTTKTLTSATGQASYHEKWVYPHDCSEVTKNGCTAGWDEKKSARWYIAKAKIGEYSTWVPCGLLVSNGKHTFFNLETKQKLKPNVCMYLQKPICCKPEWKKVMESCVPKNAVVVRSTNATKPLPIQRKKSGQPYYSGKIGQDHIDHVQMCEVLVHTHPL